MLPGKCSVESRAVVKVVPSAFFRQCSSSQACRYHGISRPSGRPLSERINQLYWYHSLLLQWPQLRRQTLSWPRRQQVLPHSGILVWWKACCIKQGREGSLPPSGFLVYRCCTGVGRGGYQVYTPPRSGGPRCSNRREVSEKKLRAPLTQQKNITWKTKEDNALTAVLDFCIRLWYEHVLSTSFLETYIFTTITAHERQQSTYPGICHR